MDSNNFPPGVDGRWHGSVDAGASTCTPCGDGSVTGGAGKESCNACAAGQYEDASDNTCKTCPAAKVSTTGASGVDACSACGTGEVTAAGQSVCETCAPGFYAATPNRTACVVTTSIPRSW